VPSNISEEVARLKNELDVAHDKNSRMRIDKEKAQAKNIETQRLKDEVLRESREKGQKITKLEAENASLLKRNTELQAMVNTRERDMAQMQHTIHQLQAQVSAQNWGANQRNQFPSLW
jgi:chromosome segregation ATPase